MTAIREFTGGGVGATLKLDTIKITKATRIEGKVVEPGDVVRVLPSLARMLFSADMAVAFVEPAAEDDGDAGGKKPEDDGGKKAQGDSGAKTDDGKKSKDDGGKK